MSTTFTSTRDSSLRVDFETAALAGQPADGGLFVPTSIPTIDPARSHRGRVVADLADEILAPWIGADLRRQLDMDTIFSFPIRDVVLSGGDVFENVRIIELFHGPTGSFKDFGARFLAACLEIIRRGSDSPAIVVVATSGDTGSAVADAFAGRPGLGVAILYPSGGVSQVQEAQLTAHRPGVKALAVEGSFDECQRGAKAVIREGIESAAVLSANSINMGRLLPQMLFYMDRRDDQSSPPTFVVPCGNLGNLTAGLLARSMTRSEGRFLAATNSNDYFARWVSNPDAAPAEFRKTLSNAMDVARPSNLERIAYLYGHAELRHFLDADTIGDEETRQTMRRVYEETGYVADPHTAVALAVAADHRRARRVGATDTSYSVIATADPAKFPGVVSEETSVDLTGGRFGGSPEAPARVVSPREIPEAVRWVASTIT